MPPPSLTLKKRRRFQKLSLTYSEQARLAFVDGFNKKKTKPHNKNNKIRNEKRRRQENRRKEATSKIDVLRDSYKKC